MNQRGKLSKLTKGVSLILFAFAITSCGKVKISDQEMCGDIGPLGAVCFHTLSDASRDILKEQWDKERVGQICAKAEAFAETKAALLKLCRLSKACWYSKSRDLIVNFGEKVEQFREIPSAESPAPEAGSPSPLPHLPQ